jgi:hypothetical protein
VKVALALFASAVLFLTGVVVTEWNGDRAPGAIAIRTLPPESPTAPGPPKTGPIPVPAPPPPVAAFGPTTQLATGTMPAPERSPAGTVPGKKTEPPKDQNPPKEPQPQQSPEPAPSPAPQQPEPTVSPEPTPPAGQLTKEETKEERRDSKCQIPQGGPTHSDVTGGCSTIGQDPVEESREFVPPKSSNDTGDDDAGSDDSKHGKGRSKKD